jgi:hypothetical protein
VLVKVHKWEATHKNTVTVPNPGSEFDIKETGNFFRLVKIGLSRQSAKMTRLDPRKYALHKTDQHGSKEYIVEIWLNFPEFRQLTDFEVVLTVRRVLQGVHFSGHI